MLLAASCRRVMARAAVRARGHYAPIRRPSLLQVETTRRTPLTTTTTNDDDDRDAWLLIDSRQRRRKLPPLGSVTRDQWDDCVVAMTRVLRNDEQLDGYALLKLDRLVHRFIAEHATLSRLERLERTPTLAEFLSTLSDYWLMLHASQRGKSSEGIPLDRAEHAVSVLMEWKRRGWLLMFDEKDNRHLEETFLTVVQAWVHMETLEGTQRAAHLLLSDRSASSLSSALSTDSLSSCFHQVLEQSVHCSTECPDLTWQLLHQMQELNIEFGPEWEDHFLEAKKRGMGDRLEMAEESASTSTQEPEQVSHSEVLSSLEQEELQKKLLEGINRAGSQDRTVVEQLIDQWTKQSTIHFDDDLLASELAAAVANFYIRIEEPLIASQWLLRVTNKNMNASPVKQQVVQNLIRLWLRCPEEEAPWHADELLETLERATATTNSTSEAQAPSLDSALYGELAMRWLQSGDPMAGLKAVKLCHRCSTGTSEFVEPKVLKAVLSFLLQGRTKPMDDVLSLAFDTSFKSMASYDDQQQTLVMEDLSELLRRTKWLSSQSPLELLHLLGERNIRPSPKMCQAMLGSFSEGSDPWDVLSFVEKCQEMGAIMSFECYQAAIQSLLAIRSKTVLEQHLRVFSLLLEDKSIQFGDNLDQLAQLTLEVVDAILVVERPNEALEVLQHVDARFFAKISSPSTGTGAAASKFPTSLMECYRKFATTFFKLGHYKKVEEIFDRVREHAARTVMATMGVAVDDDDDAPIENPRELLSEEIAPIPDSNFYNLCMAALFKLDQVGQPNNNNTNNSKNLDKREELLEELIQQYKVNRDDRLKPLPSMYIGIIEALKKANTDDHNNSNRSNISNNCRQRAMKWLDSMIELRVQPRDALPFSTAMHILLQDRRRRNETFRAVVSIYDRMTVEPDSYTLYSVMAACSRAESTMTTATTSSSHDDDGEMQQATTSTTTTSRTAFSCKSALQIALDTLTKIREKGWESEAPYNSMVDVLLLSYDEASSDDGQSSPYKKASDHHHRHNSSNTSSKDLVAVMTAAITVFKQCCADGYLTDRIKRSFERIFPPHAREASTTATTTWDDLYTSQLRHKNGRQEPEEWSRNVERRTRRRNDESRRIEIELTN